MQYKWYFCLRAVKSWDTLSLKTLLETERTRLEFSWQKHSVVLKSDESDRMWAHLIHCHLNIPSWGGMDRMDRLLLIALLAQVWWKWEPPQLGPSLRLHRTRLLTDVASWQAKRMEVMPVVPYPSVCCMETAYQVIPGDTYYHIILNVWAMGYSCRS